MFEGKGKEFERKTTAQVDFDATSSALQISTSEDQAPIVCLLSSKSLNWSR